MEADDNSETQKDSTDNKEGLLNKEGLFRVLLMCSIRCLLQKFQLLSILSIYIYT